VGRGAVPWPASCGRSRRTQMLPCHPSRTATVRNIYWMAFHGRSRCPSLREGVTAESVGAGEGGGGRSTAEVEASISSTMSSCSSCSSEHGRAAE
jgi:hypothetical protein